jgi:chromosome segregation ATPase
VSSSVPEEEAAEAHLPPANAPKEGVADEPHMTPKDQTKNLAKDGNKDHLLTFLEARIAELETKIATKDHLTPLESAEVLKMIVEKDNKIRDLETQIENMRVVIEHKNQSLVKANTESMDKAVTIRFLKQDVTTAESMFDELEIEFQELTEERDALQLERDGLEADLHVTQYRLEQCGNGEDSNNSEDESDSENDNENEQDEESDDDDDEAAAEIDELKLQIAANEALLDNANKNLEEKTELLQIAEVLVDKTKVS